MTDRPNRDIFRLDGQRAFIIGASRGIGRAIALLYADVGAEVVVSSRDRAALEGLASEIHELGGTAHVRTLDAAVMADVRSVYRSIEDEVGPVQVLVNNAAHLDSGPAVDVTDEAWARMMDVNLHAVFASTQEAARRMQERGYGRIINIASAIGLGAVAHAMPYSVSKAAVIQLTKAFAVELAQAGVTVNGIAPGWIDTAMTDVYRENPKLERWALSKMPIHRWGTVDELASAALYLATPASSFVTGHILAVDGGWRAQ